MANYEEAVFLDTIRGWVRVAQLEKEVKIVQAQIDRLMARGDKAHKPTLEKFEKELEGLRSCLQLRIYHVDFKPEHPLVWDVLEPIHDEDKPRYYQEGMIYG